MKIFYEPVNVNQWNIFEKVKSPGHIEPFLATKSMTVGDLMLLYVGQQDRKYESGVYAVGEIIDTPFILRNHPEDYCNNKETVNVRILNISYTEPLISHEQCIIFIHQFRTVHKIDEVYYQMILNLLEASCNGDLLSGQELQIINLMKDLCPDFVLYGFLAKDICKGSLFGGYNIYYKKGVNNSRGMISAKRNIKKYGAGYQQFLYTNSNIQLEEIERLITTYGEDSPMARGYLSALEDPLFNGHKVYMFDAIIQGHVHWKIYEHSNKTDFYSIRAVGMAYKEDPVDTASYVILTEEENGYKFEEVLVKYDREKMITTILNCDCPDKTIERFTSISEIERRRK